MSEQTVKQLARASLLQTIKVEFYVGLFFLIGLSCLAYLAIRLGKMNLFAADRYTIQAEFNNISGLKVGAPVELAGVPIGEISAIALEDTSAAVTLSIRQDVKLRKDDVAAVRTKGIIGDRYIKIIPGGDLDALRQGERIVDTESTVELEDLVGKFIHKMD